MKIIYDYDKNVKLVKSFDEEEYLKDNNVQMKFEFDICDKDTIIVGECHTVYYNHNTDEVFKKITKYRPIDSCKNRISPGYINSYNHEVLATYQQYKFML